MGSKGQYNSEKVCIIGRGCLATLLSILLSRAGFSVVLYSPSLQGKNLFHVCHSTEKQFASVRCIPSLKDIDPYEVIFVILAVKWPQLHYHLNSLIDLWGKQVPILLPQNGIIGHPLDIPMDIPVFPVVANTSITKKKHFGIQLHSFENFLIDKVFLSTLASKTTEEQLKKAGYRFLPANEFWIAQCVKLLTACTGARMAIENLSIGNALSSEIVRKDLVAIIYEGATVLKMETPNSNMAMRTAKAFEKLKYRFSKGNLANGNDLYMDTAYTSLHQDLNAQILTEINMLNGYIVRLGKKHGINTPLNDFLLFEIQKMEGNKITTIEASNNKNLQARLRQYFDILFT